MSLNELPDDTRRSIVRLPYRVGLYISMSDQTGGSESDDAEMAALANVVTYYVEDFCKSEFAQGVMLETLRYKDDWPNWKEDIQTVPDDCKKVFDALSGRQDVKDIVAFKNNLLEIAIAVAMAYREFNSSAEPWAERFRVYLSVLMRRIKAFLKGEQPDSVDQILNISRDEKAAINILANTLGIHHKVG
jgi:hypothetical protein